MQQNQGHSLNMHAFMYQQQVLPYASGRLRIVQKSAYFRLMILGTRHSE
jgi:hypothetical protein